MDIGKNIDDDDDEEFQGDIDEIASSVGNINRIGSSNGIRIGSSNGNSNLNGSFNNISSFLTIDNNLNNGSGLTREQFSKLRRDYERMSEEHKREERDMAEVISYLRTEGERKDEMIKNLNQRLSDIKKHTKSDLDKAQIEFDRRIEERDATIAQRDKDLTQLQQELAVISDFRNRRLELHDELDKCRKELENFHRKHHETISRMEHKFYEEKVKLQRETNAMMAEIQKTSYAEAVKRLDENMKQILVENKRMAEELRLQVQETEELQRINKKMEEENKRLVREVELNEQNVKEYAKQGYRRSKETKNLTTKVKGLERTLGQVVRELEREHEMHVKQVDKQYDESQMEVDGLKKLLHLKVTELNRIKGLAQNVLDQRQELEQFFLEALEQCKNEIREKQQQGRQNNRELNSTSPTLSSSSSSSSSSSASPITNQGDHDNKNQVSMAVTVGNLTWEDRERVLKLLFARMNSNFNNTSNNASNVKFAQIQQKNSALATNTRNKPKSSENALAPIPRRPNNNNNASNNSLLNDGNGMVSKFDVTAISSSLSRPTLQ